MIKILTGFHDSILPLISLGLFCLLFLGVAVYCLTDRRRDHHRRLAALALDSTLDTVTTEVRHHG